MATESDPIIIKKYANRRLYHTGTSSYVTLEDLAAMVRAGEDFVVTDAKSGEDITRPVLAQIIFEEETKTEQNLLPIAFLRQLIRFYGDSMQGLVPSYLQFSLESLTREQETFRAQLAKTVEGNPFGQAALHAVEEQTKMNMAMFQEAFKLFNPFAAQAAAAEAKAEAEGHDGKTGKPGEAKGADLDELKRQVAEMQSRLDKLGR